MMLGPHTLRQFRQFLLVVMIACMAAFTAAAAPLYVPGDFDVIHGETVWPVPSISCRNIASPFGPRIRRTTNAVHFHSGLDINGNGGEDVAATWHGVVHDIRYHNDGCGTHVIIRHTMRDDNTIYFHSHERQTFWTWYCHLSEVSIENGATVTPGQVIGKLGNTGQAVDPHLHWELRIGSNNRSFTASDPQNFDPNVNPLVLLPNNGAGGMPACNDTSVLLTKDINASGGPLVTARIDNRDHRHNQWIVSVTEQGSSQVVAYHELDFDRRKGYDITTKDKLEKDWDRTIPHIEPQLLDTNKTYLEQKLRLPTSTSWLNGKPEFLRAKVQLLNLEGVQIGQLEFDFTNPNPSRPDTPSWLMSEFAHCNNTAAVYAINWSGSRAGGERYVLQKRRGSGSFFTISNGSSTGLLDHLSGTTRVDYRVQLCGSLCSSFRTRSFRPKNCFPNDDNPLPRPK